jgi:HEPN domain
LSPSPEHIEYAEMLLRLAESDLQACRVLAAASDIADGAVGFHAQQAVEKALKTAIVPPPRALAAGPRRCSMKARGTPRDLGPQKDRRGSKNRITKPT